MSERYDSNVFFAPGGNSEDYVTTGSPQLKVVHKRQLVEGTVGGGVTAEAYVKNPRLNYVGYNGVVELNLDGAMNELVRGLGLRISDTYYQTPLLQSFAAPAGGEQPPESFARGIQARRANSSTNRWESGGILWRISNTEFHLNIYRSTNTIRESNFHANRRDTGQRHRYNLSNCRVWPRDQVVLN